MAGNRNRPRSEESHIGRVRDRNFYFTFLPFITTHLSEREREHVEASPQSEYILDGDIVKSIDSRT